MLYPNDEHPNENVIKWLHLSDLHFAVERRWLWHWLKAHLFPDLRALHAKSGHWDLVVFTGDLSHSGKEEQFVATAKILDDIWQLINDLQPSCQPVLLAVPGNHDLVRPDALNSDGPAYLDNYDTEATLSGSGGAGPGLTTHFNTAFVNYTKWWNECPYRPEEPSKITPGLYPGDFAASLDIRGVKLGVVGLNSALLQLTRGDYEGKLSIHPRQFYAACPDEDGPQWAKKHDVCILLTHHPTSWLNPESQGLFAGFITDQGRFPLHLYGHQHVVDTGIKSQSGFSLKGYWQSSALMGTDEIEVGGKKVRRPSYGYAVGEIALDGDQICTRFWPREATTPGGDMQKLGNEGWHFDAASHRIVLSDGVSDWMPVGRFCRRTTVQSNSSSTPHNFTVSPKTECSWFDVQVGNRSAPWPLSEEEQEDNIVLGSNPYVPGTALPAGASIFVGRRNMLGYVCDTLAHTTDRPGCISLLGERRIGKTSFLNQLSAWLACESNLVVARTTIQIWGDATPERFFEELCRALRKALRLPDVNTPAEYPDLKRLLTDMSRKLKFVIIIDEFDSLPKNKKFQREFYWNLRALADHGQIRLGYLISSRESLADLCLASDDIQASSFWNIFGVTRFLGLLNPEDVTRLSDRLWRRSTSQPTVSPEQLDRLTGAHPAFLQIALCHAWRTVFDGINLPESEIQRELYKHFQSLWRHRTESEKMLLRDSCIGKVPTDGDSVVEELKLRGILDSDGAIFSPAFAEWIQKHSAETQ